MGLTSSLDVYLNMDTVELAVFEARVRAERVDGWCQVEAQRRLLARIAAVREMRGEQVAG